MSKQPRIGDRIEHDGIEGVVNNLLSAQFTYTTDDGEHRFCLYNQGGWKVVRRTKPSRAEVRAKIRKKKSLREAGVSGGEEGQKGTAGDTAKSRRSVRRRSAKRRTADGENG